MVATALCKYLRTISSTNTQAAPVSLVREGALSPETYRELTACGFLRLFKFYFTFQNCSFENLMKNMTLILPNLVKKLYFKLAYALIKLIESL